MATQIRTRETFDRLPIDFRLIAENVVARPYTGAEWSAHNRQDPAPVEALRAALTEADREMFITSCTLRFFNAYLASAAYFEQLIKARGNAGRDRAYVWAEHWLSAWLRNGKRFSDEPRKDPRDLPPKRQPTTHTPEPWSRGEPDEGYHHNFNDDIPHKPEFVELPPVDYFRACACVDACAGIAKPVEFRKALDAVLKLSYDWSFTSNDRAILEDFRKMVPPLVPA